MDLGMVVREADEDDQTWKPMVKPIAISLRSLLG